MERWINKLKKKKNQKNNSKILKNNRRNINLNQRYKRKNGPKLANKNKTPSTVKCKKRKPQMKPYFAKNKKHLISNKTKINYQ